MISWIRKSAKLSHLNVLMLRTSELKLTRPSNFDVYFNYIRLARISTILRRFSDHGNINKEVNGDFSSSKIDGANRCTK